MKETKRLGWMGFLAAGLVAMAPGVARSETVTVTNYVSVTNANTGVIANFVQTGLNLLDESVDYFDATNQFELQQGFEYKSSGSGIRQLTEPIMWHKFNSVGWLGVGAGILTLGEAGSALNGYNGRLFYRYAYHNLSVHAIAGFSRDIDQDKSSGEVGAGGEYWMSRHAGAFLNYVIDVSGSGKDDVDGKLETGLTFKF
jgi:hypothetical protein